MKRLILVLMLAGILGMVYSQNLPPRTQLYHYWLENDTIVILPTNNVYGLWIFVDESSTDSAEVTGKVSTLDDIATHYIPVAPGNNYASPNPWNRRLDSMRVVSRDGCKAFITTLEK
jgi:hypothetical protein